MAEFYTHDRDASRLDVGALQFEVQDGHIDLSNLSDEERSRAESELSRLSLVERVDDGAEQVAAEEALAAARAAEEAEAAEQAERLARAEAEAAARGHANDAEQLDQGLAAEEDGE